MPLHMLLFDLYIILVAFCVIVIADSLAENRNNDVVHRHPEQDPSSKIYNDDDHPNSAVVTILDSLRSRRWDSKLTSFPEAPLDARPKECLSATQYTINHVDDLFTNIAELECIFAAGLTPTAVGLGYNYGTLLTAGGNALASVPASLVYQGDYVIRTQCNGQETNIGTLHIGGARPGTSIWSIGPLPGPVANGEYYNPKDNLVMDFRVNIFEQCKVEDPSFISSSAGFLPFKNSIPPINSYVDIGRVVGRDASDGGIILLNKAMASDPQLGFATVLFYAIKNFDPAVNPDFVSGTPIVVSETFTYTPQGIKAAIARLPTSAEITGTHILQKIHSVSPFSLISALLNPGVLPRPLFLPFFRLFEMELGGFNEVLANPGILSLENVQKDNEDKENVVKESDLQLEIVDSNQQEGSLRGHTTL